MQAETQLPEAFVDDFRLVAKEFRNAAMIVHLLADHKRHFSVCTARECKRRRGVLIRVEHRLEETPHV